MKNVLVSWSSGKDAAWTWKLLREDPDVRLVGLLTTLNGVHDRVSMHAVRHDLLKVQAAAAGLPLFTVPLPFPCPDGAYEEAMAKAIAEARRWGVTHVAFGDLFLEDVRRYREERLAGTGIDPLFPLWGKPTDKLSREMLASGLRAVVTCADPSKIPGDFAGRWYDDAFLNALPEGADPCGENGEFHTCVLDAPGFAIPVRAKIGEAVERDGFRFVDVVLEG